jgi:predicted RND superfamily exporter protein
MKNWLNIILSYPRSIIAILLLITLLMGWNIPRLELDADVKTMLPDDFDIVLSMNAIEDIFGGSELVIMSITSDNIFSVRTLTKIQELTSEIEDLPFVNKVIALTNVEDVKGTEFGFEVGQIIKDFPVTEAEVEAIKRHISANAMLSGSIVSEDFKNASIITMLEVKDKSSDDEYIFQTFDNMRRRYEDPETIHLAGLPLTRREVAVTMQDDLKTLFPYGIILMIFFLVFSFRSWLGAFLPFTIIIMVVINSLGLMAILGMKFTFIGLMIPVMLIAVTSSYSIHIISHYSVSMPNVPIIWLKTTLSGHLFRY